MVPVCGRLEEEIAQMEPEDKMLFLSDLGLSESGLDRLIQAGYELLGLISYLTAGKPEVRAWTIKRGTKAPQAAGKIHSDFERGFIRGGLQRPDGLRLHDRRQGKGPCAQRGQGVCDEGWGYCPLPLQRLITKREDAQ